MFVNPVASCNYIVVPSCIDDVFILREGYFYTWRDLTGSLVIFVLLAVYSDQTHVLTCYVYAFPANVNEKITYRFANEKSIFVYFYDDYYSDVWRVIAE